MGRTWLPEGFPWGCVALLCLGVSLQQVNLLQVLGVPGGQLPRRPPASRTLIWAFLLFGRHAFCDAMDCSMPGIPVLHYTPELAQTRPLS